MSDALTVVDGVTYEHNVFIPGEGWRTAILTCMECGAAVVLSRTTDTMAEHARWHRELRGERA